MCSRARPPAGAWATPKGGDGTSYNWGGHCQRIPCIISWWYSWDRPCVDLSLMGVEGTQLILQFQGSCALWAILDSVHWGSATRSHKIIYAPQATKRQNDPPDVQFLECLRASDMSHNSWRHRLGEWEAIDLITRRPAESFIIYTLLSTYSIALPPSIPLFLFLKFEG